MPRKGQAFPIDDKWKSGVIAEMETRGVSNADLARVLKVSRSVITEMFKPVTGQSTLVPGIHAFFGWPPPRIVIPSKDSDELAYLFANLSDAKAAALLERARVLYEQEAKKSDG